MRCVTLWLTAFPDSADRIVGPGVLARSYGGQIVDFQSHRTALQSSPTPLDTEVPESRRMQARWQSTRG